MPWGGRIPDIRRAQRLECNEGGRRLDGTRKVTGSRSIKSFFGHCKAFILNVMLAIAGF